MLTCIKTFFCGYMNQSDLCVILWNVYIYSHAGKNRQCDNIGAHRWHFLIWPPLFCSFLTCRSKWVTLFCLNPSSLIRVWKILRLRNLITRPATKVLHKIKGERNKGFLHLPGSTCNSHCQLIVKNLQRRLIRDLRDLESKSLKASPEVWKSGLLYDWKPNGSF